MSNKRKMAIMQQQINQLIESNKERAQMLVEVIECVSLNKQAIIWIENKSEPKLKTLDQSVFEGLDEKWRFAAVDGDSRVFRFKSKPCICGDGYSVSGGGWDFVDEGYDTTNWQDSLIERKTELTGSDLCRAMLARGDKYVVCLVSEVADSHAINHREKTTLIEQWVERDRFYNSRSQDWMYAVPVNPATNEPITQKEVGL